MDAIFHCFQIIARIIVRRYSSIPIIFEAKYYQKPLALSEIHKKVGQIREIETLKVAQLGFIAVNGFEKTEENYIYYSGEDLYR